MKLVIEIDLENDAFQDRVGAEVARILHEYATEASNTDLGGLPEHGLIDANGNRVGYAEIRETGRDTALILIKGGVMQGISATTENMRFLVQDLDNFDRLNPDACHGEEEADIVTEAEILQTIQDNLKGRA